MQFVVLVCDGSTTAPLTDYANNEIYQDLTKADKYLSSGEKMYIDLRRYKRYTHEIESLTGDDSRLTLTVIIKDAATKKIRLMVTGYLQGQYYYALSSHGVIMQYKNYGITKNKNIAA